MVSPSAVLEGPLVLVIVKFGTHLSATTDEGSPIVGAQLENVLEVFIDAIADELDNLPGARDVSVGATLTSGLLEIDFEVEADSPVEASASGLALLSTAFNRAATSAGESLGHVSVSDVTTKALALV
jgi:hypothetical protein